MKTLIQSSVLLLSWLVASSSHALPPEFTATYFAETYGMVVAQSKYTLRHNGDGVSFSQHSQPVGLAALFSDQALNENSELRLRNGQLLLEKYSYIQRGDNKNRNVELSIDWDQSENNKLIGKIHGTARGEQLIIEISEPVWDTLSFQIPVMMDTRADSPPRKHAILVKGDLKQYDFITHGTEDITIKNKVLKTIKIERQSHDKGEPIYLWVAPELNNLPVKIEKWKKNKPRITMLLNQAIFPADSSIQFNAEEDPENDFQ